MESVDGESTSSFEIVSGWIQQPCYCLTFPAIKTARCPGWTGQDGGRCGKLVSWEVWGWASIGLQLTISRLWEEEHLKPVFEEIADTFLCCDHKSQIESITEMVSQDAWRNG